MEMTGYIQDVNVELHHVQDPETDVSTGTHAGDG